ncbi:MULTISPECIES: MFS transporter [Xenorhabdus]|uniref:MFS transporter n=1 Tax=Xenorhabdus TaxID=626 RepID=UPI0006459FFE|nr:MULTISPECIES: MFS transporter [Xenorhabdus]
MKIHKSPISILLINTFATTTSRGITLPFMAIYISSNFKIPLELVGSILSASLLISIFFNSLTGYLVDRFDKILVIFACMMLFSLNLFLIPMIYQSWIMILILSLIYTSNGMLNITIKSCIADWTSNEQRSQIFSLNYALSNAGWAIGAPIGVIAAKLNLTLPFYLSGGVSILMLIILLIRFYDNISFHKKINSENKSTPINLFKTLSILFKDNSLIYFTIGSTFISLVFSQSAGYISQYLLKTSNAEFAYEILGIINPVNAFLVISLQYFVSKKLPKENIFCGFSLGIMMFFIGIIGFWIAGESVLLWVVSMVFFTFGEIIVIPLEYMFIDHIAPENLKGSYYGIQNLRFIGGALSPIVAGFLLSYATPSSLFFTLCAATLLSLFFYFIGYNYAKNARKQKE